MTEDAEKLVKEQLARVSKSRLKSRRGTPKHVKARPAGKVVKLPAKPSVKPKGKQTKAITKSDRALRRMCKRAEPGRCYTLEEIAKVMNITRERVRQIEYSAKKNFRNRLTVLLKSEGVTPEDISAVLAAANLEYE